MSSKEEKKSKSSKTDTPPAADTGKKPDTPADSKSKAKREKSVKQSLGPVTVVVDHSGLIDKKHTDATLVVGTNQLSIHKAIVNARNDHLLAGVSGKKNKRGGSDYEIKDVEFQILKLLVHWLYSDKVDFSTMSLTDAVKLIKAATHYHMDRLAQLCEQHLQASLSLDNVWDVMSLSYAQNVERAKQLCMEFACTHHDVVLADPRFRKLEVDMVVDEMQMYNKYRPQLESGWLPPKVEVTAASTIVDDFKALYESMSGADHTVVVEKQNIKCHKAILGHASPKLMELADGKDSVTLPKDFKNVSASTFSALLKYLYYGNTDIEPMAATQLIAFAKQLGLQVLVDVCEAKIRHGIDTGTCLSILEVAYHPMLKDREELQKELKVNCKNYFIEHIKDIDVRPLKSMDAIIGAELLLAVQGQIGLRWMINQDAPSTPMLKSKSHARISSDAEQTSKAEEKEANTASNKEEGDSKSEQEGQNSSSAPISAATASGTAAEKVTEDNAEESSEAQSGGDKSATEKAAEKPAEPAAKAPEEDVPPASPTKLPRSDSKHNKSKDKRKEDKATEEKDEKHEKKDEEKKGKDKEKKGKDKDKKKRD